MVRDGRYSGTDDGSILYDGKFNGRGTAMKTYQCNKEHCQIYSSHGWKNNFLRRIYFLIIFLFCISSLPVVTSTRDGLVDAVFLHDGQLEFSDV